MSEDALKLSYFRWLLKRRDMPSAPLKVTSLAASTSSALAQAGYRVIPLDTFNMLREIGTPDKIPEYIARAKDKNDPFRLMGFGHRVYKNYDPRAKIMQKTCHEVLDELGLKDDPLLEVAMELEHIALNDEYFIEKKLYPNVDFYSGITLKALGFPTTMFTVLFALARTVGWIAQWKEMIEDPQQRIGRPRQLYTGSPQRDYLALDKRS